MCTFTAITENDLTGNNITWKDVWEQSPTGEIWPIHSDYNRAFQLRRLFDTGVHLGP